MSNLTMISVNGGVRKTGSGVISWDSTKVYSQEDIRVTGSGDLRGHSTLSTPGSIDFSGSSDAVDAVDGGTGIGVALIAGEDIDLSGSGNVYLVAIAGGTFEKTGSGNLYGHASATGRLRVSESATIHSGFSIESEDVTHPGDDGTGGGRLVLRVLSVR